MDSAPLLIALLLLAYLLGSISSAILVCRLYRLPDPRLQGSLNPGATNVYRIGGRVPALLTLLGDGLKGVIPVLMTKALGAGPTLQAPPSWGTCYRCSFGFRGARAWPPVWAPDW